ncbi:MAG: ATP-dependent Clp protease proteolytic subunit [Bacteroidota bacterium]
MSRRPNPKARTLVISERISQKIVGDTIKTILDINRDDDDKAAEFKAWKREPIELVINTFGGSVYDGLALINAMQLSKTPVHTIALGNAMSMGLFILAAGKKRFIAPHSTVMYHQISTIEWDKIEGLKNTLKELERLEKICENILFKSSKLTKKELEPYKREKKEWYFGPEEALKWKVVDKIL